MDGWAPSITLKPAKGQSPPLTIVAQAVRLFSIDNDKSVQDLDECFKTKKGSAESSGSATSGSEFSIVEKAGVSASVAAVMIGMLVMGLQTAEIGSAWIHMPELPANDVTKHEWRVEMIGIQVEELPVATVPQELEGKAVPVELPTQHDLRRV